MSLLFFVLVAAGLWREYKTAWRPYQERFRIVLEQQGQRRQARAFSLGIQQIWIPQLGVVDRCVTCHLGYDYMGVLPADLAQPLTPHPLPSLIARHSFNRFGCTTCHGGQGWATEATAAHDPGDSWNDPMLTPRLAARYELSVGQLLQMRCNFCHRHEQATPGMSEINLAKQLYQTKKCAVCHMVEGAGGHSAPDLTYEGDVNPELLDFSHLKGPHTLFNWEYQHFIAASALLPTTAMPDYGMTPPQARAMALLMLSWKRLTYPPEYIPAPPPATHSP